MSIANVPKDLPVLSKEGNRSTEFTRRTGRKWLQLRKNEVGGDTSLSCAKARGERDSQRKPRPD